MEELVLDTRDLEPPAPMQLVLSELQSMLPGIRYIHQIHRIEPVMLFNRLQGMGIEYIVKKDGSDYHIYYFHAKDKERVMELIDV